MPPKIDIEAQIRFLSTMEGGGPGPYLSRLTTTHDFGIEETLFDALHVFPDVAAVRPGDTVRSQMSFLAPESQRNRLYEGFSFTVQEGHRIIGRGRVTKILNETLRRR
jgi:translation elongation factor EF-Tu-like GTPase